MKALRVNDLVGKRIENVFEESQSGGNVLVLIQVEGIGMVPLELVDPYGPSPDLFVYEGRKGKPCQTLDVQAVIGHRIADVIVSEYLGSVSFLIDDGRILGKTVQQDLQACAEVESADYLAKDEYRSLVK